MLLCLRDEKQPTVSSEPTKAYKKPETSDCLRKWETRQNIESNQLIRKLLTADRKY